MRSVPPDSRPLDDSWALEDTVDLEATQPVDSEALLAAAGLAREEHAPPHVKTPPAGFAVPPDSEGKITLPPPIPVSDYVAQMMVRRPHSSSEITAVQRGRPPEEPEPAPPPAPSRRTIPWEPPGRDKAPGKGVASRETPRLGLECDEPGVASRPSGRMGFGALSDPELELDDDFLRQPSYPFPPGAPDFSTPGSLRQPGVRGLRVPHSAGARESGPGQAGADRLSNIDFRLDLGFEETPLPSEGDHDLPPITPPPGTLRYGLLEDEDDFGFRVGAGSLGEPHASWPPGGHHGDASAADADNDQATAPGFDIRAHLRSTAPRMEAQGPRAQMQLRFDQGDFGGALVLAEALLEEDPDDAMARQYADSCVEALRQMYQSRLGDGSRVLRLAVSPDQLRSLNLDHRAGFLLSCIDGCSSIDEILDVSGMRTLEALRILYELVQEGVVCGV